MDILRFGAIDIGSNSIRLLIENVFKDKEQTYFKKGSLIRVPIRLGESSFTSHQLPQETVERLSHAMQGFYHIMKANGVLHYKACATSAMRETGNAEEVIDYIFKKSGIKINVISGKEEAAIIYHSQKSLAEKRSKNCLFIDVGGGSTEMTLLSKGEVLAAKSFNIGTIRLLNNMVEKKHWREMKDWVKFWTKQISDLSLIGSGGNINRIAKLLMIKEDKPLDITKMKSLLDQIEKMNYDDRLKVLDLNPDRADVIVPAGTVFLEIMKAADVSKIYVPKIGLSDGIIRVVYDEYIQGKSLTF